jgi:uncharacterized membrane protein YqhA
VQSAQPIVVRVMEEPVKSTGVADILVGALGLTGVMLLAALLLGALLGGVLIGIKKLRAKYNVEPVPDSDAMRVTPSSSTP